METSRKVGRKPKAIKEFSMIADDIITGTPITLQEIQEFTSSHSLSFTGKNGNMISTPVKHMTVMGIQKVEVRALAKLKAELARRGIKKMSDILASK